MRRRQFIEVAGLGSIGLCAGLSKQTLVAQASATQPASATTMGERFQNLYTLKFETIQLNQQGQEVTRQPYQSQFFTVELGEATELEMVAIRPGRFLMGTSRGEKYATAQETPQHRVQIQPFFIGKYPITQAQWRAVAALPKVNQELIAQPAYFRGETLPVESVSWLDAMEFCARLSRLAGITYRLPSEAEWEYACRAGTTTAFAFGETMTDQVANYGSEYTYAAEPAGSYRQSTTPVGQFPPNAFGLSDMHGNVWEWCADTWHDNYVGAPADGRSWLQGGNPEWRTLRGGGWAEHPARSRSAQRSGYPAHSLNRLIGFRACATSA